MPTGHYFLYQVYTGSQAVCEYEKDEKIYIESDLQVAGVSYQREETTSTAHGEQETQSWPVTPYTVFIDVNNSENPDEHFWFEMFIDGRSVWNKPLKNGRSFTVTGTFDKQSKSFRELLFSLPRFAASKYDRMSTSLATDIGTIEVVCKEALFDGYRQIQIHDRVEQYRGGNVNAASDFRRATKADCAGGSGGNEGLMTTTVGREMFRYKESGKGRLTSQKRFKRGRLLEKISMHYRMKEALIELGIVKAKGPGRKHGRQRSASESLHEAEHRLTFNEGNQTKREPAPIQIINDKIISITKTNSLEKQIKTDVKTDILEKQIKQERINRVKTYKRPELQPIKTRVREEIIEKVNDKGEKVKVTRRVESMPIERYIRVDDDIFIVESLDDSVVIVGDDDCYVVEPPVQEFPFVELDASLSEMSIR